MKKWIYIFLLIFFANFARAETFSWAQVIQKAREQNADILEQQQYLKATEAAEKQTLSNFLPSISGSISSTQTELNNQNSESVNAGLNLRYNLFAGFSDLSRYSQAKERTLIARLSLQQTLANLSTQLKESFANLTYAKSLVSLNELIVKRRFENMRMVQLRYESGSENKGSYLQAKAYYEEADYNAARSKLLVNIYQTELATLMGINPSSDFDIVGEIEAAIPAEDPEFERITHEIPPVLQADAQIRVAKYDVEVAKRSRFLPSLDLSANIGQTDSKFFPELNSSSNAGLTLSIPLFDGFGDFYGIKSASAQALAQAHARDRIYRAQLVLLKSIFTDYKLAHQKLRMTAYFKEAAAVRGKISRERYNNGLMTFENWDNVESENIQRERTYLETKKETVVVEARWERALGKGVFNDD